MRVLSGGACRRFRKVPRELSAEEGEGALRQGGAREAGAGAARDAAGDVLAPAGALDGARERGGEAVPGPERRLGHVAEEPRGLAGDGRAGVAAVVVVEPGPRGGPVAGGGEAEALHERAGGHGLGVVAGLVEGGAAVEPGGEGRAALEEGAEDKGLERAEIVAGDAAEGEAAREGALED